MLFKMLEAAIRTVEGAELDSATPEPAYLAKYGEQLRRDAPRFGWTAETFATAYGVYQILGENLARHHGISQGDLGKFLTDPAMQYRVARKQFYLMLETLIQRRGAAWPGYLLSMWNAGINYNAAYTEAMVRAMKGAQS